ncbi:LuxR C-terminal-related transcriptional regulator [Rhodoblastus sp.]|uniref:LuxR C-terminal-related transcriptional regulator n=1 Tax=Rhodoblastus sp. TaxID=1962975 RepID=UPI003F94FFBB
MAEIPCQGTASVNNTADEPRSHSTLSDLTSVIVIVERNDFLRDCLQCCVTSHWPIKSEACASLSELTEIQATPRSTLVVLSLISLSDEQAEAELALLKDLDPCIRTMVLSKTDDFHDALIALRQRANGYISLNAQFEFFIQALRFVGAGGTYFPAQCLLTAQPEPLATPEQVVANGITSRELSVIQAIRQGKSNKVIAYELNMCESTVKVHVRNIMKKLNARNRTDVAIKGADLVTAPSRAEASGRTPFCYDQVEAKHHNAAE